MTIDKITHYLGSEITQFIGSLNAEKLQKMKNKILSLNAGDYVWNVCGLAPITEITYKGISEVDGMAFVVFKTKFCQNSTISGSIRENRLVIKDNYLADSSILQFIPNHKASDFI